MSNFNVLVRVNGKEVGNVEVPYNVEAVARAALSTGKGERCATRLSHAVGAVVVDLDARLDGGAPILKLIDEAEAKARAAIEPKPKKRSKKKKAAAKVETDKAETDSELELEL